MQTITQSEFRELTNNKWPHPVTMAGFTFPIPVKEVGWFRDGEYLGTITHDLVDDDFGYVVLGRDDDGEYRGVDVACS